MDELTKKFNEAYLKKLSDNDLFEVQAQVTAEISKRYKAYLEQETNKLKSER